MATNVVFTGEPGIGKSYMAIAVARMLEGLPAEGKDRFPVDQVVFTFSEFMDLVLRLKSGKINVFDEPSYAIEKREWYRELNQALTKTIESFRFKVHPLFIPVVNKSLKNTEIYITVERTLFGESGNDEFTVKVAETPQDIKALLEVGFEYICQKDNLIFMRKRK
jgi:DNA polymerase III delta prime subunit